MAKLIPRVTDLRVGGTLRVILAPLCDTIPCFGAAVISLRRVWLCAESVQGSGLRVEWSRPSALRLERAGPGAWDQGLDVADRCAQGWFSP